MKTTFIFIVTTFMFMAVASQGIKKGEIHKCLMLEKQAHENSSFWVTKNQKQMCDHREIAINAPIK